MAEIDLPDPAELAELRSQSFTKRVAFTTAAYAVGLALTALGGSNAMKDMLLAQQQASDQWAFYQAKVIREHQYRIQQRQLDVAILERGAALTPEGRQAYEALRAEFAAEAQRYGAEKKDIESAAKQLEQERDVSRLRDPYFDFAEVLLQIAIVMSSIAILSGSHLMYTVSLVLASVGVLLMGNGFFLWGTIPFFHSGH